MSYRYYTRVDSVIKLFKTDIEVCIRSMWKYAS